MWTSTLLFAFPALWKQVHDSNRDSAFGETPRSSRRSVDRTGSLGSDFKSILIKELSTIDHHCVCLTLNDGGELEIWLQDQMQSHHFAAVMNHYIHFDEASMSEGSVSHDHELGEDDPRPEAGSKEENKEENALQRPPAPLWMRVLAATALADMQESIQHMIENNASMGSRGGQEKPGGAGGH